MNRYNLAFGELKPDAAPFGHDGLIVANNVVPVAGGYAPLPAFAAASNGTLASACLGAGSFKAANGGTHTFAGTASNLYSYARAGWTSVGSGYLATADFPWRFEQFGNRVIATNGVDAVQSIPFDGTSAVALAGSPPKMRFLATVREFLFGGVINGDVYTLAWSGSNNCEQWVYGTNQSDYQTFPVGGAITGITGGEYGLVFQENRITRASYVGGNLIFQFDEISANVGCIAPRSICQYGNTVFFLSARGFMACDGNSVTPIGDERIDRAFRAAADTQQSAVMSATVDPVNKRVIWTVPVAGAVPQTWYIYSFGLGRWSTATQYAEFLFQGLSADYTLDDLDAITVNLDALPYDMDSNRWRGAVPGVYVVNDSHAIGTMSGSNSAATLTFPDVEPVSGRSTRLRRVRPVVDASGGLTVTIASRQRLGDSVTTTAFSTLNTSGDMPCRKTVRSMRPSLGIAAATVWTFTTGLQFEVEGGFGR